MGIMFDYLLLFLLLPYHALSLTYLSLTTNHMTDGIQWPAFTTNDELMLAVEN